MSFLKLFSFNNLLIQYIIAFATLLIAVNISQCLEGLITAIGRWAVVAIIAWFGAKRWRRHHNNRRLTAYKRAVLVTGCDSGFGNALAMKLNEHGFRVYATVLDTEGEGARNLLTRQRFDGQTRVVRMDVTSDQEVNKVYETVAKELVDNGEQLWAVVNNAGILTLGPLDWGTVDTYKRIHEVNTFGMVRVTRVFLPLIRQSKGLCV
ncbi:unnamed protein product [Medioppia subpectinata]|uniref:Uncharacterized protein n=1 Tax=Medioppia subpectinata TaxID=1979941 RepID=A0A7R9LNM3_9ACAR|nr:unnamed protein product [Medioppia subpectinata]CAG2120349.1 unnamed protein product [Medioppia subpectinata]